MCSFEAPQLKNLFRNWRGSHRPVAFQIFKGPRALMHKERLRELNLLASVKRKLQDSPTATATT